jgi:hypothetical protein
MPEPLPAANHRDRVRFGTIWPTGSTTIEQSATHSNHEDELRSQTFGRRHSDVRQILFDRKACPEDEEEEGPITEFQGPQVEIVAVDKSRKQHIQRSLQFMKLITLAIGIVAFTCSLRVQSQTLTTPNYTTPLREASADCPHDSISYLPVQCWIGRRFIFLPSANKADHLLEGGTGENGMVTKKEAVGRIGTFVEIGTGVNDNTGINEFYLVLKMEDNGQLYRAAYFADSTGDENIRVDGLALVDEIDYVRIRYQGKQAWLPRTYTRRTDPVTHKLTYGTYAQNTKLTITDVGPSTNEFLPVEIRYTTPDGLEWNEDFSVSETNTLSYRQSGDPMARITEAFSLTDPNPPKPARSSSGKKRGR